MISAFLLSFDLRSDADFIRRSCDFYHVEILLVFVFIIIIIFIPQLNLTKQLLVTDR